MHQLPTGHKSAFCAAAVAVALAAAMLLLAVVVVAACCLRLPLVKIKKILRALQACQKIGHCL